MANFESLKYTDQKYIKEQIESNCSVVAPQEKGKGKKRAKPSEGLQDFGIEYSKSSRAECRGCLQKIMKDEVRIKKVMFDTEVGMKYGGQPYWHHVECFEKVRDDLGYFASGDQLPGFKSLNKVDQANVTKTIK